MIQLKAILFIVMLFSSLSTINATIYYVSAATGSDANPGTELLPWLIIGKAAETLVAGDTALVKEGVYEVSGTNTLYLPKGIYVLNIIKNDHVLSKQFIKE